MYILTPLPNSRASEKSLLDSLLYITISQKPGESRKGVIILDEYGVRGWGESDAVDEFFDKKNVTIQSVPNAVTPTAYVIKD